MKRCKKCGSSKPHSEFYVRTDGTMQAACKECYRSTIMAKRTGENREAFNIKARVWSKTRHMKVKNAVFAAYGGYRCACCGETQPKFLTLDHVNNDGAAFRRSTFGTQRSSGYRTYSWLVKRGFPDGYQVLCMNCNFGKRMSNGVCPHSETRNDYPQEGVGPSGPKRTAPLLKIVSNG